MTAFDIYLITRCDAIQGFLTIILVLVTIAITVTGVVMLVTYIDDVEEEETPIKFLETFKYLGSVLLFSAFGHAIVPSTKEAVAMILIPAAVNNEEIQKVPENTLRLFNAQLEAWLEDVGIRTEDEGE